MGFKKIKIYFKFDVVVLPVGCDLGGIYCSNKKR